MSYSSQNKFGGPARIVDLREFVELLDYEKAENWRFEDFKSENYFWFDDEEYRSWTGVELSIYVDPADAQLTVSTRSIVSRSYFDLVHQNKTIQALRSRFGGYFETDEGRGRYLRPRFAPPAAAASGCHLAYSRFGSNLIKVLRYLNSVQFANEVPQAKKPPKILFEYQPRSLSNNMINAFLVSILEDFLKSTYVALLSSANEKEKLLRSVRLQGDHLYRISQKEITLEAAVAESLSFQNVITACKNIQSLNTKLDLLGVLRRPFRGRRKNLLDLCQGLIISRHNFIHRANLDPTISDDSLVQIVYDLEVIADRIEHAIFSFYKWQSIEKSWGIGRRPKRT